MKLLAALILATMSFSSFAITSEKLVESCRKVGIEKIVAEAEQKGLSVDPQNVSECGLDNRPLNISKYVWFCATTSGGEEDIQVLTQKPLFRKCF
jgi:hypothetical protein